MRETLSHVEQGLVPMAIYVASWISFCLLAIAVMVKDSSGLLWNLEAAGKLGFTLSFFRDDWPRAPSDKSFRPLILISIPLIMIAA
jgi:hypothetical protein